MEQRVDTSIAVSATGAVDTFPSSPFSGMKVRLRDGWLDQESEYKALLIRDLRLSTSPAPHDIQVPIGESFVTDLSSCAKIWAAANASSLPWIAIGGVVNASAGWPIASSTSLSSGYGCVFRLFNHTRVGKDLLSSVSWVANGLTDSRWYSQNVPLASTGWVTRLGAGLKACGFTESETPDRWTYSSSQAFTMTTNSPDGKPGWLANALLDSIGFQVSQTSVSFFKRSGDVFTSWAMLIPQVKAFNLGWPVPFLERLDVSLEPMTSSMPFGSTEYDTTLSAGGAIVSKDTIIARLPKIRGDVDLYVIPWSSHNTTITSDSIERVIASLSNPGYGCSLSFAWSVLPDIPVTMDGVSYPEITRHLTRQVDTDRAFSSDMIGPTLSSLRGFGIMLTTRVQSFDDIKFVIDDYEARDLPSFTEVAGPWGKVDERGQVSTQLPAIAVRLTRGNTTKLVPLLVCFETMHEPWKNRDDVLLLKYPYNVSICEQLSSNQSLNRAMAEVSGGAVNWLPSSPTMTGVDELHLPRNVANMTVELIFNYGGFDNELGFAGLTVASRVGYAETDLVFSFTRQASIGHRTWDLFLVGNGNSTEVNGRPSSRLATFSCATQAVDSNLTLSVSILTDKGMLSAMVPLLAPMGQLSVSADGMHIVGRFRPRAGPFALFLAPSSCQVKSTSGYNDTFRVSTSIPVSFTTPRVRQSFRLRFEA